MAVQLIFNGPLRIILKGQKRIDTAKGFLPYICTLLKSCRNMISACNGLHISATTQYRHVFIIFKIF